MLHDRRTTWLRHDERVYDTHLLELSLDSKSMPIMLPMKIPPPVLPFDWDVPFSIGSQFHQRWKKRFSIVLWPLSCDSTVPLRVSSSPNLQRYVIVDGIEMILCGIVQLSIRHAVILIGSFWIFFQVHYNDVPLWKEENRKTQKDDARCSLWACRKEDYAWHLAICLLNLKNWMTSVSFIRKMWVMFHVPSFAERNVQSCLSVCRR